VSFASQRQLDLGYPLELFICFFSLQNHTSHFVGKSDFVGFLLFGADFGKFDLANYYLSDDWMKAQLVFLWSCDLLVLSQVIVINVQTVNVYFSLKIVYSRIAHGAVK
jgi:hypothetical protein